MEIGTGSTITFASGFFAKIISAVHSGISRPVIDATHFGSTTAREKIFGNLYDPGELQVTIGFAPGTSPPILAGTNETCTVTHTDAGAATWAATAEMTNFEYTLRTEDRSEAQATLTYTGAITITP